MNILMPLECVIFMTLTCMNALYQLLSSNASLTFECVYECIAIYIYIYTLNKSITIYIAVFCLILRITLRRLVSVRKTQFIRLFLYVYIYIYIRNV